MSRTKGCLKYSGLGCLGLLGIVIVVVGITALVAWNRSDDQQIEDRELSSRTGTAVVDSADAVLAPATTQPGRLILDLSQGGFEIMPGEPGEGIRVDARYDAAVYELKDSSEVLPDSTWVYRISFRRTVSDLHALFRQLMGAGHNPEVFIYIPPDIPIELVCNLQEGGYEVELGGLWLTSATIDFKKGGCSLSFDDPLREPMESLAIRGRMGGLEAMRLGNASPRVLDMRFSMGGAEVDLRGEWLQDCDANFAVVMGGMEVDVPRNVEVRRLGEDEDELEPARPESPETPAPETAKPVLTIRASQLMGEVEVR